MQTPRLELTTQWIRSLATGGAADTRSDAELLRAFTGNGDELAFVALLRRHGPMVLAVCRRLLRDPHAAEDAFQTTFLVLVRKAGNLRKQNLLAGWLYGVAYRTAMQARRI